MLPVRLIGLLSLLLGRRRYPSALNEKLISLLLGRRRYPSAVNKKLISLLLGRATAKSTQMALGTRTE
jgi:hypothetical protein